MAAINVYMEKETDNFVWESEDSMPERAIF